MSYLNKTKTTILSCILVIVIPFTINAKPFTILATPSTPFKISAQSIDKRGISIEILTQVMNEMGIDYKIKLISTTARVKMIIDAGEAEMLINYSKSKSRMSYLSYPKESYRSIDWNFFIRKEDKGKIKYETFEDLKGLKIGIVREVSYTDEFLKAGDFLDFKSVSKKRQQIPKLINKRIDIVPMSTLSTLFEELERNNIDKITYLPKPLKSKLYYDPIVTKSSYFEPSSTNKAISREVAIQQFLDKYDLILKKLKKDGFVQRIYGRYGLTFQSKGSN
jgi:polar amino acid transport system substrate-binding protein